VGKLSSWIETDSELTTERRNSEAVCSHCHLFIIILQLSICLRSLCIIFFSFQSF